MPSSYLCHIHHRFHQSRAKGDRKTTAALLTASQLVRSAKMPLIDADPDRHIVSWARAPQLAKVLLIVANVDEVIPWIGLRKRRLRRLRDRRSGGMADNIVLLSQTSPLSVRAH